MWWKNILRRRRRAAPLAAPSQTIFDEAFLRRLDRLSLQVNRTPRGGLSGAHPSLRRLPAPTFSDHRPYTVSDDLRYIDWNAYARQEHLFVKLGENEQDIPVHLLLDRSASMDYGTGDNHKLHYGRIVLAALGYIALASGDQMTATAFDTALTPVFGPARSNPGGPGVYDAVIRDYIRLHRRGLLVVIGDMWAAGDLEQVLRAAPPPRWQVLLLHLLHRDEMDPQVRGEFELEDSETGEYLPFNANRTLLQQYHTRLVQWCNTLETTCQRHGATYVRITTDLSIERAVIPYLRQRQLLGG
jgi:uncharacterized protein (DUF58 family)